MAHKAFSSSTLSPVFELNPLWTQIRLSATTGIKDLVLTHCVFLAEVQCEVLEKGGGRRTLDDGHTG